jgi:hypothetical protein
MDDYVCDMSMVGWDRYSIATSPKKYIGKDLIVVKKNASQVVTTEFFYTFVYRPVLLCHG